jgi:Uma2 family endonuclease
MTIATSPINTQPLLLDVSETTLVVTPAQFDDLCLKNPDLRLELTSNGELVVMAPTFSISGQRNGELFGQVWYWNKQTKLGQIFDSSSGYDFTAIGGGKLSPDVSWIEKSRLAGISLEQFCPVVPDFVIELRSTTDNLIDTQKKMVEYQRLGVKLGLLVNPQAKQVEIYRLGKETEVLEFPVSVDCGDTLPGFVLSMAEIW